MNPEDESHFPGRCPAATISPVRTPEAQYRDRDRQRRAREAARRREAAALLRIASNTAGYASARIGNGLAPAEARQEIIESAVALGAAADSLRRLVKLSPGETKGLVLGLTAQGVPAPEIALRLGISHRTVYRIRKASRAPSPAPPG